jgi:hypothetical protein
LSLIAARQVAGLNVDSAHPALNCWKSHEQRNSAAVTKGCDEQVAAPLLLGLSLRLRLRLRRAALTSRRAQLILHITFMGTVRIKAIMVRDVNRRHILTAKV